MVSTGPKISSLPMAISGRTPSEIALGGVARTFQNVQLFGEMTATENVLVGLHNTFKSNVLDVMLQTPRYKREERAALFDEVLPLLRRLWSEDSVDHDGPRYPLKAATVLPKPVQQPHPPIWVGGEGVAARKRAAELGDGWYPTIRNPNEPLDDPARFQHDDLVGIDGEHPVVGGLLGRELRQAHLDFLLHEWLDVSSLTSRERFAEHSRLQFRPAGHQGVHQRRIVGQSVETGMAFAGVLVVKVGRRSRRSRVRRSGPGSGYRPGSGSG